MMGTRRALQGLSIVAACCAILAVAATGRPQATVAAQAGEAVPTPKAELAEITKILGTGPRGLNEAAERLEALDRRELETGEREDWLRLARTAALRRGDRARLESLRNVPDRFALVLIQRIFQASASLAAADFAAVRAQLAEAGDPESMNEREKRRCYAIEARLAQLEGDAVRERACVDKLVDHLQHWPKPMCQSCHATLAEPDRLTHLKVSEVWFGDRFVALMQDRGDAERIRAESEARLSKRPGDARSRIRLGFALRALGREEEALEAFRALPWADFPDRPVHKPRMMTTFP